MSSTYSHIFKLKDESFANIIESGRPLIVGGSLTGLIITENVSLIDNPPWSIAEIIISANP